MNFKERMLKLIYEASQAYSRLLNQELIFVSNQFRYQKQYVIHFNCDNFLHLTGVHSNLAPTSFYKKAINRTLSKDDFVCEDEKFLAFTVRRKLVILIDIDSFFDEELVIQEKFSKGRVRCLLATSDSRSVIGFDGNPILAPKSILAHYSLPIDKQIKDFVIIRNKRV